ncbi:PREDICTED: transmembrane protein 200B [Gekko japonicus]|uniref:Transmembrane protein 200B n=1 Tax=Gekko japonicus TaxID=146911 RepID=A0ABM1KYU3_GEKJA|nr:PREDICTED: transmembrane protein 200B [Gekko japonicus]
MKNDTATGKKPGRPSRWHRRRFRCKVPSEVTVKGQLRMRSPSGAFVMVGVSVVLVGMTIAVIGYWPHRGPHGTRSGSRPGNSSTTDDLKKEVKVSPHPRLFLYSEKLKLIGPVIMGIGLFIFICANTMLYENRDMETRLLMQRELYSMTLGLPQDASEVSSYFQRRLTPSTFEADPKCVEGCYEVDLSSGRFQSCPSPVKKWANAYRASRLQTTAQFLHHVSPSASLVSIRSDSGNSARGRPSRNPSLSFPHGGESVISSAVNALSLPLIKLNNCLLENQGVSPVQDSEGCCVRLPEEKEEVLRLSWTVLPGDSSSISSSRDYLRGSQVMIDMDGGSPSAASFKKLLHAECTKRGFSSDTQIPMSGHSRSLDLGQPGVQLVAPAKERKHRSWPRLDQIGLANCAKLGSRGESSDQLLEAARDVTGGESGQNLREVVKEAGSRV